MSEPSSRRGCYLWTLAFSTCRSRRFAGRTSKIIACAPDGSVDGSAARSGKFCANSTPGGNGCESLSPHRPQETHRGRRGRLGSGCGNVFALALALTLVAPGGIRASAPKRRCTRDDRRAAARTTLGLHARRAARHARPAARPRSSAVLAGRTIETRTRGDTRVLVRSPGRVGHWEWAELSRDGSRVLAEWSAECEVPVAYEPSVARPRLSPIGADTLARRPRPCRWAGSGGCR